MRATCGAVLIFVLAFAGAGRGEPACDPHQAENDRAKALHAKGDKADQDAALAIVRNVLRADPKNFRANYLLGAIQTDKSGVDRANGTSDRGLAKAGVAQLDATVELLKQTNETCAVSGNWYSVYNSTGAEHFNVGDLKGAERYLLQGYQMRSKMKPDTQAKLLSNLGRLYTSLHNFDRAAEFYAEAKRAGAPAAA